MMRSMIEQFATFAASKPAEERYNYVNPTGCAFMQFMKEIGGNIASCADDLTSFTDGSTAPTSDAVRHILQAAQGSVEDQAREDRWTFGALAARLATRKASPDV